MTDTPQTDASCFDATTEKPSSGMFELSVVYAAFARKQEREITSLRNELADVTAAFQKECDHEWEKVDDSFSHEFGTEVIRYLRCEKCGKQAEWDDVPHPEDDIAP